MLLYSDRTLESHLLQIYSRKISFHLAYFRNILLSRNIIYDIRKCKNVLILRKWRKCSNPGNHVSTSSHVGSFGASEDLMLAIKNSEELKVGLNNGCRTNDEPWTEMLLK